MPGPVHICSETLVNMASVFIQDLRVFNQDQTTSSCSNVIGARWFMDSGGQIRRALSWFDLGTDTGMIRTVYWYLLILPWNIDPRKNIHFRSMVCGENEMKGRGDGCRSFHIRQVSPYQACIEGVRPLTSESKKPQPALSYIREAPVRGLLTFLTLPMLRDLPVKAPCVSGAIKR